MLFCPEKTEILPQVLRLLPRGRAWQTHEGLPAEGSVLRRYWSAWSALLAFATERLCALHAEFFCASATETRDLWLAEYGLPDACDPSGGDLCLKVSMQGGTRGEFLEEVAARYGFDIEVTDPARLAVFPPDSYGALPDAIAVPLVLVAPVTEGLLPGVSFDHPVTLPWTVKPATSRTGLMRAGCHRIGCMEGCGADLSIRAALARPVIPWAYSMRVLIRRATSPALDARPPARLCRLRAGCSRVRFRPDLSKIQCVIDRITHAHIRIVYQIV